MVADIRSVAPSGWVNVHVIWDNGLPIRRGHKASWWLAYNVIEERFSRNKDYVKALEHGHEGPLSIARNASIKAYQKAMNEGFPEEGKQ
jgi:hypothetical protein